MTRLCFECHELREIYCVNSLDRGYCAECTRSLAPFSIARAFGFPTIPLKVGDKVEAYMAGELFDGVGHVDKISLDGSLDGGTPIVAMFHVVIDEPADELAPAEGWYVEKCLRKVGVATELEQAG
jgi:hypothetical protein